MNHYNRVDLIFQLKIRKKRSKLSAASNQYYITLRRVPMIPGNPVCNVDTVLFDFGGVLAEEGFANGLRAIAQRHGMNENEFFVLARELIYGTGYVTGRSDEAAYWQAIRDRTGITDSDDDLRNEILSRFVPRPFMFDIVRKLRGCGYKDGDFERPDELA